MFRQQVEIVINLMEEVRGKDTNLMVMGTDMDMGRNLPILLALRVLLALKDLKDLKVSKAYQV
ncbi:MAG: hypothetical protein VB979_05235 [Acinetobacter sp.]|uniref:hypothetical protein n=1 Tax=Acinetobacter sp. TaxID=472 RepID=UPI0039822BD3